MQNKKEEEEVWKDIPEYEGIYQVSSYGNVRSLDRPVKHFSYKSGKISTMIRRGVVMRPGSSPNGYKIVRFSKEGKPAYFAVHRLVALLFIANPHNKPTVNHIDGNKVNNKVTNLEWVTSSENQLHAIKTGLVKEWKNQFNSIKKNPYAA